MTELNRATALRLLDSVSVGRIVFTQSVLPAVRPVSHLVHDGLIVIHSHAGATLISAVNSVVAYEADLLSSDERAVNWSVVATGFVRKINDPAAVARYECHLHAWVGRTVDQVLASDPQLITGFTLTETGLGP